MPIPAGITDCEVSWRSWAVDSRDREVDRVLIDGVEVWSTPVSCPSDGWEIGPQDFPNPWGGENDGRVCFMEHVVDVECSGLLNIQFLSAIDQAEADESWAFSDLQIIGSNGETVLLDETLSSGVAGCNPDGWSNAECSDVGSAGHVHGPWGNDVRDVSIDIALPADTEFCEISWRQWAIDSRDNEVDRVNVDGEEVWSMAINRPDAGCDRMGWEEGPADFPAPWGGPGGACFDLIEVQTVCSGETVNINFLSGIDQAESDEAWAFSDVRVVARPELPEAEPEGGH